MALSVGFNALPPPLHDYRSRKRDSRIELLCLCGLCVNMPVSGVSRTGPCLPVIDVVTPGLGGCGSDCSPRPAISREHFLYVLKGGAARRRRPRRCLRPAGPYGLRPPGWRPRRGRQGRPAHPEGADQSTTSASAYRGPDRTDARPVRDTSASWPGTAEVRPTQSRERAHNVPSTLRTSLKLLSPMPLNARKHGLPHPPQPPLSPCTRETSQVASPEDSDRQHRRAVARPRPSHREQHLQRAPFGAKNGAVR
jgi:hypothetical protein